MAAPERRIPARPCLTAHWPAPCRNCGAAGATHAPIFHRGLFCAACCPCCSPTAPPQPRAPTQGPRPPHALKPAPKRMAPGSQFLDLGFGRPDGDFYGDTPVDKAVRSARPPDRWVPRRERWFPGRR
jgi:hypothetical protein